MSNMKKEQWIDARIKILLQESNMSENDARSYLNTICDFSEKEGVDYDEMIFYNWLKLGDFIKQHHKEEELQEIFCSKKSKQ